MAKPVKTSAQTIKEISKLLKEAIKQDIVKNVNGFTRQDAKFLYSAFKDIQKNRVEWQNRAKASNSALAQFLADIFMQIEEAIKYINKEYCDAHPIASYLNENIYALGPGLITGLMAYLDIEKAPNISCFWRFAGLDPTIKWEKGKKRPFCSELKTICWLAVKSFIKHKNNSKCVYGRLYERFKKEEIEKNEKGKNAEYCKEYIKNHKKLTANQKKYYLQGKLPPAHIESRAIRKVAKALLSDIWLYMYEHTYNKKAPLPYALVELGHTSYRIPFTDKFVNVEEIKKLTV